MHTEVWITVKEASFPFIHGRITSVKSSRMVDHALTDTTCTVVFRAGKMRKHVVLKPGIIFRVMIPDNVVDDTIRKITDGTKPHDSFEARDIHPINEPCVRVPLSLLMALRGQDGTSEAQRRAVAHAWSEDRRTGRSEDD